MPMNYYFFRAVRIKIVLKMIPFLSTLHRTAITQEDTNVVHEGKIRSCPVRAGLVSDETDWGGRMKKNRGLLEQRDFQILLFSFSVMLFVWPFLGTGLLHSLELLYLYFFGVWGGIIVLHIVSEISGRRAEKQGGDEKRVVE